jgi:Bacteriophage minor capsid protein
MSGILEFAGGYLDSALPSLTLGSNLFLGKMQTTPDVAVCIYEYEGAQPMETMGSAPTAVDMPRIQIVARGGFEDYPGARDLAVACRTILAGCTSQTLLGVSVLRIRASASVLPMGEDEQNRPRFSANFQCWVTP